MTLSIESTKTTTNQEFGNNQLKPSGIKFRYTFDNGLMTRIDFDAPVKSHCIVKTDTWQLFAFLFKGDAYRGDALHTVDKNFTSAKMNEVKYLYSYILEAPELSCLLRRVVDKLNISISTNEGLSRLASLFIRGNYTIIGDHIRNTCMVDLYSLIRPSKLPTEGDLNSYIPTKEEYEELDKVIRMYTFMFGEMFTLMLMPMNPSGLILRSRKCGMTELSTINIELK